MNQFLNPLVTHVISDMIASPKCIWKITENKEYYGIYTEENWTAEIRLSQASVGWNMKIFFHYNATNSYDHYYLYFRLEDNTVTAKTYLCNFFPDPMELVDLEVQNKSELLNYLEQFLLIDKMGAIPVSKPQPPQKKVV